MAIADVEHLDNGLLSRILEASASILSKAFAACDHLPVDPNTLDQSVFSEAIVLVYSLQIKLSSLNELRPSKGPL